MWKKILVPIDFSEPSKNALRLACDMARRYQAEMTLLNVFQIPGVAYPEGFIPAAADIYATLQAQTESALAALKREAELLGATGVSTKAAPGAPFEEILREAETYDVIVMGTHGRTGLSHVFLGSVAEHVVRLARCPVVTVRLPKSETARASKPAASAQPLQVG